MMWLSNISKHSYVQAFVFSPHRNSIISSWTRFIVPDCDIVFLDNWHLANFLLVIYIVWLSLLPPFPFSQLVSPQLCISYLIPAAACTICGLDGWGEPPDPRRTLEEGSPPRFEQFLSTFRLFSPPSSLLECLLCLDVRHRECGDPNGKILTKLANSWECPACTAGGQSMDTS